MGTIANIAEVRFDLTAAASDASDFAIGPLALNTTTSIVLEPATIALLGGSLIGIGLLRRRSRT